jgi:hypothetical protein
MDETDQRVASLFSKKSHHRNTNGMYIAQNLFHRRKHHRTISLNAHYMVVHEIVQNYQVFISGVEGVQFRQSLLKVHSIFGSV